MILLITSCEDDTANDDSLGFSPGANNGGSSGGDGIGGSLNRFTTSGDHLYVLNETSLIPFDISDRENPTRENDIHLGVGIETILVRGENIFVGTTTGMHIFDISIPSAPELLSTYQHVLSCDPVAVSGDVAYVTLREGTGCGRLRINRMDVVDISNLKSPFEIRTIAMDHPHGLGVDGDNLFVTQGDFGIWHYDIANERNPRYIDVFSEDANAFDVIALNGVLTVTGKDGVRLFDYSDQQSSITLLSKIDYPQNGSN